MKKYIIIFSAMLSLLFFSTFSQSQTPVTLDYDIVYVKYKKWEESDYSRGMNFISQGEHAYVIIEGADLILHEGSCTPVEADPEASPPVEEVTCEKVLVDCTTCSVIDPFISFDGNTVYYSKIENASLGVEASGFIWKIDLTDPNYTPIQLTFDNEFDNSLYAGNADGADLKDYRGIRDMSPSELSDGRIMFTSNRHGYVALDPKEDQVKSGSVQLIYTMDNHDGSANTPELANMRPLEIGSMQMVQHPFQLLDGRILFTTWQSVGHKFDYAMSPLFTVYPDGTGLNQFTEPHETGKLLDHFATQLNNGDVVAGKYYPSFDFGYGILERYPVDYTGPDFIRGSVKGSRRDFDRKGTVNITPHTTAGDEPAPNRSGKYSMPSIAPKGNMLVAYSTGYVNVFNFFCTQVPNRCEGLKSGIYMIKDATRNIITDPNQLLLIKDDPEYNEIWPRAVVPYSELYGVSSPSIHASDLTASRGATGLVGTSSMYNRETAPDEFVFYDTDSREFNAGNCLVQGCQMGLFDDADIYGIRIVGTPAQPYNTPMTSGANFDEARQFFDSRLQRIAHESKSSHNENWRIMGEFPLTHRGTTDAQGNPDTSWVARVPADTPFLIQAITREGETMFSDLSWRTVKAGEARTDCGGCHVHSKDPLDFATTQAGQNASITGLNGVSLSDPRIQDGIWDLTTGTIPILGDNGDVQWLNQRSLSIEFRRDVYPILQSMCPTCDGTEVELPDLTGTPEEVYKRLRDRVRRIHPDGDKQHFVLNMSDWIRTMASRESLLTWVIYGERRDGRTNDTVSGNGDIDYLGIHPPIVITPEERRTITRWIDMGMPYNFSFDGDFQFTDDYTIPVIAEVKTALPVEFANHYQFGIIDADSEINWSSLVVSYYNVSTPQTVNIIPVNTNDKVDSDGVLYVDKALINVPTGQDYVLKIDISDAIGNKNIYTVRNTK